MSYLIKQPESTDEFEQYYALRYQLLRKPWGEPEGSEKDDMEDDCFHIIARQDDDVIGVGRIQNNSAEQAQIRYMAVAKEHEGRGIGRKIVNALEAYAKETGIDEVVLDAREPAVGFYERLGYHITEKSYLLFGEIQHYRMMKRL